MGDMAAFRAWRWLKWCPNVETFCNVQKGFHPNQVEKILRILEKGRHQSPKYLDGIHDGGAIRLRRAAYGSLLTRLLQLIINGELKLYNVEPSLFYDIDEAQCMQFAPRISSLVNFDLTNPRHGNVLSAVSLPQVVAMSLVMNFVYSNLRGHSIPAILTKNLSLLSTEKMPKLRQLVLMNCACACKGEGPTWLAENWANFPCVEELVFNLTALAQDITFCGGNGELPFLQLTSN